MLLQNRAGGFRIQPGHPNCIAPRKRPLHTIIPGLMTKNGRSQMSFGVMGGQYQPTGQCHVLTNILDYGCDIQEAIDMPRGLHYEGVYQLEDGVPAATVEGLNNSATDHEFVGPLGGGTGIWIDWDKGSWTGDSELIRRKDGCALGYSRCTPFDSQPLSNRRPTMPTPLVSRNFVLATLPFVTQASSQTTGKPMTTASGLQIIDTKVGTGASPKPGQDLRDALHRLAL